MKKTETIVITKEIKNAKVIPLHNSQGFHPVLLIENALVIDTSVISSFIESNLREKTSRQLGKMFNITVSISIEEGCSS